MNGYDALGAVYTLDIRSLLSVIPYLQRDDQIRGCEIVDDSLKGYSPKQQEINRLINLGFSMKLRNGLKRDLNVSIWPLTDEDAKMVYKLVDESRDSLKNLVWTQTATLESTYTFLEEKMLSDDTVYGIFENGEFVGMIELRDKKPSWELGYWLGAQYRGRGIMKEAVKLLVKTIKDRPVTAHIRDSNIASYKTLIYAGLHDDHVETWNGELWKHLTNG